MTDQRTMIVPEGLAGERVDAALARLFGLSRTRAADLAAGGSVIGAAPCGAGCAGAAPSPGSTRHHGCEHSSTSG